MLVGWEIKLDSVAILVGLETGHVLQLVMFGDMQN